MSAQEAITFYKNSEDKQNASHTILVEGNLTNKVVYYLFKFIFEGLSMGKEVKGYEDALYSFSR